MDEINVGKINIPLLKGERGETGQRGQQGEKGQPGYSPVRGVDYWTSEDEEAIKEYCDNYIDSQFSLVLDNINGEVV